MIGHATNIVFIKLNDVLELVNTVKRLSLQKGSVVSSAAPICVLAMPLKMTVGQCEVTAQWGSALQSRPFHLQRGCLPQVEHEIKK